MPLRAPSRSPSLGDWNKLYRTYRAPNDTPVTDYEVNPAPIRRRYCPDVDEPTYFSTRLTEDPRRAAVWTHVARYLRPWVRADGSVLDLAAGRGELTAALDAKRRVAIDLHPGLAELVPEDVEAVVGDATDLSPFADAEFDTVTASNFIEHLEHAEIDRCFTEVFRVLRPGGHLILIQPNFALAPRAYFDDYTHRTIHTDVSLADRLGAAGFDLVHIERRFLPLSMRSRLSFGHRLVPLYLRLPWRPLAGQMLLVARRP